MAESPFALSDDELQKLLGQKTVGAGPAPALQFQPPPSTLGAVVDKLAPLMPETSSTMWPEAPPFGSRDKQMGMPHDFMWRYRKQF